jgi:hypothetical protein
MQLHQRLKLCASWILFPDSISIIAINEKWPVFDKWFLLSASSSCFLIILLEKVVNFALQLLLLSLGASSSLCRFLADLREPVGRDLTTSGESSWRGALTVQQYGETSWLSYRVLRPDSKYFLSSCSFFIKVGIHKVYGE